MRGEHNGAAHYVQAALGSSPHARGAHARDGRGNLPAGLIPACAGSTGRSPRPGRRSGAHPRMRGEHGHRKRNEISTGGSSPHARGAPSPRSGGQCPVRLIPACAGSTVTPSTRPTTRGAHPRMRGEHVEGFQNKLNTVGSSPHARGAPVSGVPPLPSSGLIPACAGSTHHVIPTVHTTWAHPRMRGEHCEQLHLDPGIYGSSPHARGARRPALSSASPTGLIPACAGSTSCPPSRRAVRRAHPRMRGEHIKSVFGPAWNWGSSPHARGAPLSVGTGCRSGWLIPACAGST